MTSRKNQVNQDTSTPDDENPLLEMALYYADMYGWYVLPNTHPKKGGCSCGNKKCLWPGKHPDSDLVEHGVWDASKEPKVIRMWWELRPQANVGVATGRSSGIFMVGPDGEKGIADLAEVERKNGKLPETLTARSGGGGRHRLFKYPKGAHIGNYANHRETSIDIRGEGGQFIAPPSLHKSGLLYEWASLTEEIKVAAASGWLIEWAGSTGRRRPLSTEAPNKGGSLLPGSGRPDPIARAMDYLATIEPAVSGQRGRARTLWAARAMAWGFDLGAEKAFELLRVHWNPLCVPPWSQKDLWRKCQEGDTPPYDKPRGWLLKQDRPRSEFWTPRSNNQSRKEG